MDDMGWAEERDRGRKLQTEQPEDRPEGEETVVEAQVVPDTKEELVEQLRGKLPPLPTKAEWLRANKEDMLALVEMEGISGAARLIDIDRASVDNLLREFRRRPPAPSYRTEDAEVEVPAETMEGPRRTPMPPTEELHYLRGKVDAYERVLEVLLRQR